MLWSDGLNIICVVYELHSSNAIWGSLSSMMLKIENVIKNWIWLHCNSRINSKPMYGESLHHKLNQLFSFASKKISYPTSTFHVMKLDHWINTGHLEPKTRKYLKSWPRTGYGMVMTSLTALNQRAYSNTIECHRPHWVHQTKEFTVVWGRSVCPVLSVQT